MMLKKKGNDWGGNEAQNENRRGRYTARHSELSRTHVVVGLGVGAHDGERQRVRERQESAAQSLPDVPEEQVGGAHRVVQVQLVRQRLRQSEK